MLSWGLGWGWQKVDCRDRYKGRVRYKSKSCLCQENSTLLLGLSLGEVRATVALDLFEVAALVAR